MFSNKEDETKQSDDTLPYVSFNIILGTYLNSEGSLDEMLLEVKNKLKSLGENSKLEQIVMKLILLLNPSNSNFNSWVNKDLIISLLQYLVEEKKKKSSPSPALIYNIFSDAYSEDSLLKILFEKDNKLNDKEESYLYLLVPFIIDRNINSIVSSVKSFVDKESLAFIEKVLVEIDIKTNIGIRFLKNILLSIVNSEKNQVQAIQGVLDDYFNNEKNNFYRCKICYSFPQLFLDSDKKIAIKYPCDHVEEKDIINLETIRNYKPKCSCCSNYLHDYQRNYLCSNCKSLFCNKCLDTHFIKCLTIFFIPFKEVGLVCPDHNSQFETFCSICNQNLCSKCKEEHIHFSNYSTKISTKFNIANIINFLNSNDKITEEYKNFIKLILSDDKYLKNLQFKYFLENILEKPDFQCGFFKEFGDINFNEYYSTLIREYKKGNIYYIQIYEKIKEAYSNKNLNINEHKLSPVVLHLKAQKDSKINSQNSLKATLLVNYFIKLNEIKELLYRENNNVEKDNMIIDKEKSEIKINSLSLHNNRYKEKVIQLIHRSIADNILRYLIKEYSQNFNKINLDLALYNDIKENFRGDIKYVNNFQLLKKQEIKNILDNAKNKLDISGNNSEETEFSENNDNQIAFSHPIVINNRSISVEKLNIMIEFLFYLKEDGNLAAHPKPNNRNSNIILNEINTDDSITKDNKKFFESLINAFKKVDFKNN